MPDPSSEPVLRNSLKPATAEHEQAADLLSAAADAFLDGKTELARQYLHASDFPALFQFGRLLMARKDPSVKWPPRLRSTLKPPIARVKDRMPTTTEARAIYDRDGWRCRYCGCRVIYGPARKVLSKAFPEEVPWPRSGPQHGGFFALTATPDHIVPHALGGDNSAENLVTACWPCNFGMEHDSLDELGLSDPRLRAAVVDGWDGLTRLIAHKPGADASPALPKSMRTASKSSRPESALPPEEGSTQALWIDRLDPHQRQLVERLVELLDRYAHLGVTWSAKAVLVARMDVGDHRVQFFGVEPNLAVQVPWSTNTSKAHLRQFAETVAESIPGATVRETPNLWNVDVPPAKTVPLVLLLENEKGVGMALQTLHRALNPSRAVDS